MVIRLERTVLYRVWNYWSISEIQCFLISSWNLYNVFIFLQKGFLKLYKKIQIMGTEWATLLQFCFYLCRGHHSRSLSSAYWFGIDFTLDVLPDTALPIYLGLGPALWVAWAIGAMWGSVSCPGTLWQEMRLGIELVTFCLERYQCYPLLHNLTDKSSILCCYTGLLKDNDLMFQDLGVWKVRKTLVLPPAAPKNISSNCGQSCMSLFMYMAGSVLVGFTI